MPAYSSNFNIIDYILITSFFVSGSAIFFEIKHWKPKRKMTKLKCYSFLDQKAIQPGPISLRL